VQHKHLALLAQWVQGNAAKFTPGTWYFAGRPMSESAAPTPR
jgi:hypothetical protein